MCITSSDCYCFMTKTQSLCIFYTFRWYILIRINDAAKNVSKQEDFLVLIKKEKANYTKYQIAIYILQYFFPIKKYIFRILLASENLFWHF